jgi:protein ImuB
MAKSQAAQFCDLEIRHRSPAQERAAHAALLDLGWSLSPRIEDTAPDTIVSDVAGLASLFGSAANIAREFVARAVRLGLAANVAIASNIEAALIASRGFPGITLIPPGDEAHYLGDLPVEVLPTAPETLEILDRWGVRTCAALAALPLLDLSERLGQEGVRLHELARGANVRSLVLAQTSLDFEEEMSLDDSVEDLEPLSFILGRLLDQLCARLDARALALQSIHVRFELEPAFENGIQRLKNDTHPSAHHKPLTKSYEKSLTLPVPMRDPKNLLKLLRLHLQSDPPQAPILKVTMSGEPAARRSAQGGLFAPVSPDPEKLELTVARLANLVGDSNVGSPELVDTHRPGEFRITRFRPVNIAAESRSSSSPRKNKKSSPAASATLTAHQSACPETTRPGSESRAERDFATRQASQPCHPEPPTTTRPLPQPHPCHPECSFATRPGPQSEVEVSAFSFSSGHGFSRADQQPQTQAALAAEAPPGNNRSHLGGRSFSSDNKTGAKRSTARGDFSATISGGPRHPLTVFRAFRPAPSAKVDMRNARPARVAFNGQLANVVAASGPWRTSGDWWREDTWQHDEWDLELRFESIPQRGCESGRRAQISNTKSAQPPPHGVYCLYFDAVRQSWFVRGVYD